MQVLTQVPPHDLPTFCSPNMAHILECSGMSSFPLLLFPLFWFTLKFPQALSHEIITCGDVLKWWVDFWFVWNRTSASDKILTSDRLFGGVRLLGGGRYNPRRHVSCKLIYICLLGQCRNGSFPSTMPHASLSWQGCPVAQLQHVILLSNQEHLSEKYGGDPGIENFWYTFKVQHKIKYRLGGKNQRERSQEWVSRCHLKMEVTRGRIQDSDSWNNSPALI